MALRHAEILKPYIIRVHSVFLYPIVVVVCVIHAFQVLARSNFYSLCIVKDRYMRKWCIIMKLSAKLE